jgi:hypothetical protein
MIFEKKLKTDETRDWMFRIQGTSTTPPGVSAGTKKPEAGSGFSCNAGPWGDGTLEGVTR